MRNFGFLPFLFIALTNLSMSFAAQPSEKLNSINVAVQLSDPNPKLIEMGLKNIKAMLSEAGAAHTSIEIKAVTFGPALASFQVGAGATLSSDVLKIFQELRINEHVHFYACENTLKSFHLKLADLLPGFSSVPSGAYEIIRLQKNGFQYFRP